MNKLKDKILGCLVGAALGDAMGAPTETRTREQIETLFGGYVRELLTPPDDVFAHGNVAGQVTDDFSMAYVACETILKHDGIINQEVAEEALIEWSKNEAYFEQFVGPTSRAGILRLRNKEEAPVEILVNDNLKQSNGAAMKAAPIALFGGRNIDKAMDYVITMARPTHNNKLSLSGACAIAAAVSHSLCDGADLDSIVEYGIYGAQYGERFGNDIAGASVSARIEQARTLGLIQKDKIGDVIGNGANANESVPAAFGLIVAYHDQPLEALYAAVNIGNDTDSIATMVGGIIGAFHGVSIFKKADRELIDRVNGYDLENLAESIMEVIA